MKKVLIVSIHFPPLNSMASKRYGYMCKYMEENGYEPYVLTTRARGGGYMNAKLDLELPIPEERVFRVGDLGIIYPIDDGSINNIVYEDGVNKVSSRVISEESLGWFYKVKRELDLNKVRDVDIVLGTFPLVCNLFVGEYIARQLGKPYVAEVRDLISDYGAGIYRNDFWQKRELQLEKELLADASGIVTVTEGFRIILQNRFPEKKIITVYNGWDGEPEEQTETAREDYLYYAGSMYDHRVESFKLLIDTIYENSLDTKIKIRSIGPEIFDNQLKSYILKHELQNQIEIFGAVSEKVVKKEQGNAKINLLVSSIHKSDQALMTTIPGKLFELIRLKNPVMAIVADGAEVGDVLDKTGKGKAVSDKEAILSFLTQDYLQYEGYRVETGEFSRRNQTKKLCEFFDELIKGGSKMNKLVTSGISLLGGAFAGAAITGDKLNKIICEKQRDREKFRIMYQMMERWMRIKQSGCSIVPYFETYGYKKIAIYGLGDIGKLLLNELKDSSIKVEYAIDKNKAVHGEVDVVTPEEELKNVDAIVVTAVAYYDEINEMLSAKIECPIISLEDIIYEVV